MLKCTIVNNIGTSLTTVQTVPASNVHIVLMISVKNLTLNNIKASIQIVKSTGEIFKIIAESPVILPHEVLSWEGKMFLEAGDMIKAISDTATSIDIMTNYVEKVNN